MDLMDETSEFYEANQLEAWEAYDLSIGRVRPYTYYFPYLTCPHSQNAIDVTLRRIWVRIENERAKEREQAKPKIPNPKTPGLPSPMMVRSYGK